MRTMTTLALLLAPTAVRAQCSVGSSSQQRAVKTTAAPCLLPLPTGILPTAPGLPRSIIPTMPPAAPEVDPLPAIREMRLMTREREALLRRALPATDSPVLRALLAKPLVFYRDAEMPPAYQDRGSFYATSWRPEHNANNEFPWQTPAGAHKGPALFTFRFAHFPAPITFRRGPPVVWTYAVGTVFAEVLCEYDPRGMIWPFELRTRTKFKEGWHVGVFRPFTTRAQLAAWLAAQGEALPPAKPVLLRMHDSNHDRAVFDQTALVDELPEMRPEIVRRALLEPFRSALGQTWVTDGKHDGFAPTSAAAFGIVPQMYAGVFLRVERDACLKCHEHAGKDAKLFAARRDWSGSVRGGDGIFSFHLADQSCISADGQRLAFVPNKKLVAAGLLREAKP